MKVFWRDEDYHKQKLQEYKEARFDVPLLYMYIDILYKIIEIKRKEIELLQKAKP